MSRDWLKALVDDAVVGRVIAALEESGWAEASGAWGSCSHLLAGALVRRTGRPVLLVSGHLDDADEAADDLSLFDGMEAVVFGALEVMAGEANISLEQLSQRLELVGRLERGEQPPVIVAPIAALMQAVPGAGSIDRLSRRIEAGGSLGFSELVDWLEAGGYRRVEAVGEVGDYAVRGGIVDLIAPGQVGPVRLDFFGDQVDQIAMIDLDSMGSGRRIESVHLVNMSAEQAVQQDDGVGLWQRLDERTIVMINQAIEVAEQGRGYYERLTDARGIFSPQTVLKALGGWAVLEVNAFAGSDKAIALPVQRLPDFSDAADRAVAELGELVDDRPGEGSRRVVVLCQKPAERDRFEQLLGEQLDSSAPISAEVGYLYRGFCWGAMALVPHHELFHRFTVRRRVRMVPGATATDTFFDLSEGDYVVHMDHGIARFKALRTMRNTSGASEEYLTLQFADKVLLHVPTSQIERVQKYVGGFAGRPPLSKLGGTRWSKQKQQAAESVRNLAGELLRVQAARASLSGIRYGEDTDWMRRFEAEFPYTETDDQLAAMAEIKKDMADGRPMDRLLCGDVGYGKTELAVRAAFKAIEHSRQVAVLCPTTVLCKQHECTFRQRMADYPIRVESLSRFKSPAETRRILADLATGQVDLVIGTHRLLSDDVAFKNLGLIVVDEEQRFGVEHKNKLMRFRVTVDVLTMSATPIPRTLHLALLGLRSISSLSTPPADRRAVVTEVAPYDPDRIRQAIRRELNRDGQCYFVHNRVRSIEALADEIRSLVPEARVAVGHGQMRPRRLEEVMLGFIDRQIDVLVCTTIIESGIDIPTANTMFIHDADWFGLAELHQLRGRVGRYKHRAYCYLLLPQHRPVSEVAARRLRAIEQYSMLGAGFKIAMRDMEIRGVGNILGPEQSGHIATVGYQMYCQLLDQATRELRHEAVAQPVHTHLELNIVGHLPRPWIPNVSHRLTAYRRIAAARTIDELRKVENDLRDAWGALPEPAGRLFDLAAIRIGLGAIGVEALKRKGPDLIFSTAAMNELYRRLDGASGSVRLVDPPADGKPAQVFYRPPADYLDQPQTLLSILRKRFVEPIAGAT